MKAVGRKIDWKFLLACLVIGVVLTALFAKLPFISRVTMMWLDLIIINGGFSIWLGRHYSEEAGAWKKLFVFPILYLIGGYFFTPHYMWYFALIYLGVSYLAWSMKRNA
ncbi:hypothetical protein [Limosilactobacillus caecicola]|uniref:hypothetical protein n=1 Tax=Limosilactobacillus caecicola TaxID=2941332 RepID=UPI0020405BA7|nr:hypothetical protein [Limosilactobacillus caecicola]